MDQFGKQFVPEYPVVRVGQPVEFRNSDTPDDVRVARRRAARVAVFDTATDPFLKHTHTVNQGGLYDVSCDIHPGMAASLVVATSPFVAFADASGRSTIEGMPPVSYRLRSAIAGQDFEQTVDVLGPRTDVTVGAGLPETLLHVIPARSSVSLGPCASRRQECPGSALPLGCVCQASAEVFLSTRTASVNAARHHRAAHCHRSF